MSVLAFAVVGNPLFFYISTIHRDKIESTRAADVVIVLFFFDFPLFAQFGPFQVFWLSWWKSTQIAYSTIWVIFRHRRKKAQPWVILGTEKTVLFCR